MNSELIKSFLVGLGFDIDDKSYSKFMKSITEATVKVALLYTGVKAMAAGTFAAISKVSEGFEQMGYEYRLIAPAINKALVLRRELLKAYAAAGINIREVIQQSIKFNMSLAKTQFALKAIYTSVAAKFFPLLTKQLDVFRKNIYANMPKIQAALEKFITFIFKALEVTTILGNRVWGILSRVYDFFLLLDEKTNGWSTIIFGVIAAWKLLNFEFLATPLGMLFGLGLAVLALWDDFKTFKEGGQSLINWGSDFTKMMLGLAAAIGGVAFGLGAIKLAFAGFTVIKEAITLLKGLNTIMGATAAIEAIMAAPLWVIVVAIGALVAGLTLLDSKWKIFGGHLSGLFSSLGGKIMDFVGGPGVGGVQNAQNAVGPTGPTRPLGATNNIANQQQTNQNVSQQTNINVMGSADANGTANAVASQQSKVNFDMVRNLSPRVQ